jgi:hypothetical protein
MSYCAYELDVDTTDIKKELLNIYNNLENVDQYGAAYIPVSNDFTKMFDDCICNIARFTYMPAGKGLPWHLDNNAGNDIIHQAEGVPSPMPIPNTINILLSKPIGDITYFGRLKHLSKFSITTPSWKLGFTDEDFVVMDSIEVKNKPVLLNTSTFHKIQTSTEDRIFVSFCVWPGISFTSFVDWCIDKNLIVERQ